MAEQRAQEPVGAPEPDPVPRDMPDQQARSADPWDLPPDKDDGDDREGRDGGDPGDDLPDTDEAGTGPRGAPRTATVHPEHPGPDESPA
ncbi:hypothetical protein [Streptomyces griseofuscus]|uniref:Uncharacterized protein n=1 Tax=Streptomyces griseofuscus TaxID=146922 RepID=A0A426RYM4_9ACTN|nr:hypothetical protein [Streptomyces griseofuscus]RRQ80764.1 hypothetical protein CQW44_32585 [Streptomyces griseofuscus]